MYTKKLVSERLLAMLCLVFIGIIIIQNSISIAVNRTFLYLISMIFIIPAVFIFVRIYKVKTRYFALTVFILAFFLKAMIAVAYNAPPVSDFANFYNSALKAARGDFSFSSSFYYKFWSYQTGIVLYYALLIKIFGSSIITLKIVNCVFIAGTNVLVYLISRLLLKEKFSRFISVFYLIYPSSGVLASVLTNQHISNFLIICGMYVFIRGRGASAPVNTAAAALLALGNAMRPQAVVVILSLAGAVMLEVLLRITDKKPVGHLIISVIGFLAAYMIIMHGLSLAVKIFNINENGLKNSFPLYKFAMGLNDRSTGRYSWEYADKLLTVRDPEIRNERALEIIKEELSHPVKFAGLVLRKQYVMWADMDDSIFWGFNYLSDSGIDILGRNVSYKLFSKIIQGEEKAFYIVVLILAFVGIVSEYNSKRTELAFSAIQFVLLFNFAIYSLIEVQTRYRDFQMIFMFIASARGIEYMGELIKSRQKKSITDKK